MLFFRRNLYLTIISIFLCIQTFSTASDITPDDLEHVLYELDDVWNPEADMKNCLDVMRKYCGRNVHTLRTFPIAADCVRQAIITWRVDIIPEGVLRNYYFSFIQHPDNLSSFSSEMSNPNDYCNEKPSYERQKCMRELVNFQETVEDAVKFALYSTKIDDYCFVDEQDGTRIVVPMNKNAFDYMLYIRRWIFIYKNPYTIPDPLEYCTKICYNPLNKESPLDWTPYL